MSFRGYGQDQRDPSPTLPIGEGDYKSTFY